MKFLNTPIGNDTYVAAELNKKLDELREKVKSITDMPFKMEAFTLLRECLSQCRVIHLMRTIPPQQINAFLTKWDRILREGFEKLIGSSLEDRWWAISRLNSKYGGIGLKSGKNTAGAQHLTSLVNSAEGVRRFIPSWNLNEIAETSTAVWFHKHLGMNTEIPLLVKAVDEGTGFGEQGSLSLAQWCEAVEEKRAVASMRNEERLHIISNRGPGCGWIRSIPLGWKSWEMKPRLWVVAVRRRLFLPVAPRTGICPACLKGRVDTKGEHQVTCGGKGGLIMRHNCMRDLLKQELENAGHKVEIERNAGSDDKSKPGDLKVLRWERGLDLYIDISCINPKADKWRSHLVDGGASRAALACEKEKIDKYTGKIDTRTGIFLPFIMEVQGGVGKAAADFMLEVQKRKRQKACKLEPPPSSIANVDLMTTLSIELQRLNSEMILQRQPTDAALEVHDFQKLNSAKQSALIASRKSLMSKKVLETRPVEKTSPANQAPAICSSVDVSMTDEQQSLSQESNTYLPPEKSRNRSEPSNSYKEIKINWAEEDSDGEIDFSTDALVPIPKTQLDFKSCCPPPSTPSTVTAEHYQNHARKERCRPASPRLHNNYKQAGEPVSSRTNLELKAYNPQPLEEDEATPD